MPPAVGEMRRHTQRRLNDGWILLFGVPIVGFLLPQMAGLRRDLDPGGVLYWASVAHGAFVSLLIWVGLRNWGRKRHLSSVWVRRPHVGWAGYVLISAAAGFFFAYGGVWVWYRATGLPHDVRVAQSCGWMALILVCVMTQLYLCLYVRADLGFASVRAAELLAKANRMRLQSSTYRQEPEAVLDALAVLRGLVQTSPKVAVRHAQSIALVHRYVLRESSRELVILRDELALLDRHANLLAARGGRALTIEIRIDPGRLDRYLIVPVSLHTLLEVAAQSAMPIDACTPGSLTLSLLVDRNRLRFAFGPACETFDVTGTEPYRALDARTSAIVGARCSAEHLSGTTVISVPLLPIVH